MSAEQGATATASPGASAASEAGRLGAALDRARDGLLALQREDGHWCFELEADCTIPSEYILMMHFMDEVDADLQERLARFVRSKQCLGGANLTEHGGWPLYHGGPLDLSCTVKAYWALKLAGDDPRAPHMARARRAVLERGGAARTNVFTRIAMALFGEVPWRAVPFVPVEIVLLPRWFFFSLARVSYWTRTVVVPLSILVSLRARAVNPTGRHIDELFVTPPEVERGYFQVRSPLNRVFLGLERVARRFEPLIPGFVRAHAVRRATAWFTERLNGHDGLGAIFPAMVNAYEALALLGRTPDDPDRRTALEAIQRLVIEREREGDAYCQPCVSPVWDTGLAALALEALEEARPDPRTHASIGRALDWLEPLQVLEGPADWRDDHPELPPGGWAFQYANPHYPDLDDTSVVVWAMHQHDRARHERGIGRALDWLRGMQSRNGGFAAFDADNTSYYLNELPFADHGALLDPPTADVSARCVLAFALTRRPEDEGALYRALGYLYAEQQECGAWWGRWGTNHVYGTWSVLSALEHLRDERKRAHVERAVRWLESVQRPDGSWGEDNDSYDDPANAGRAREGTVFQTAWALLALLAAGEGASPAVRRGVDHLLARQGEDGLWEDEWFTAPGFPRVFYLRYHGYARYFPLWALARAARALGTER